ncbi:MAG: portal protein [Dehalococcoidia bacterium]
MPRPTNDDRLKAIHREALEQFDRIYSAMEEERKLCKEDRRFYSIPGAQWEGKSGEQFANKPMFEVNKCYAAVMRPINENRNNRVGADFISKDGMKDDDLADACDGLFRADEHDSTATEAYDNGFEEAAGGGFGAWRLSTEYENEEDPDDDKQRIKIEPIYEADQSVWFDLDAKKYDKTDAKHAFVLTSMTPSAFEKEYDESPSSWPEPETSTQFDWNTPDVVYIAEYFVVEDKGQQRITYQGASRDELKLWENDITPEQLSEMIATGYHEVSRKTVKRRGIHKYILCGNSVLEDCKTIAGKYIPIIPMYGMRWFVDNTERCMGRVRLAKDAQRLYNAQLSKVGEISAISALSKPIFTPEQVVGLSELWAKDNIANNPYLLVNPITDASGNPMPAGPIAYTKPPEIPEAVAALLQITDQAMKDIFGNYQETEKVVSNISGKAIELAKANLDVSTFNFHSNFAKSVQHTAMVWLSMAREVYVEDGRKMKTIGATAEDIGSVELGTPAKDPNTGALVKAVDFSRAKFDVSVTVGPSSVSKREATIRALTNMIPLSQDPETQQVLMSMIMMNMEGEGVSDVREYFRKKLVQLGVMKPTDEEKAAMDAKAQEKDPNALALEGMAEEAQANAVKARAGVLKVVAEVEKIKADTIKTLADTDIASTKSAMEVAEMLTPEANALIPNVGEQ